MSDFYRYPEFHVMLQNYFSISSSSNDSFVVGSLVSSNDSPLNTFRTLQLTIRIKYTDPIHVTVPLKY